MFGNAILLERGATLMVSTHRTVGYVRRDAEGRISAWAYDVRDSHYGDWCVGRDMGSVRVARDAVLVWVQPEHAGSCMCSRCQMDDIVRYSRRGATIIRAS